MQHLPAPCPAPHRPSRSTGDSTPAEVAAALKPLQELRAMLTERLKVRLHVP